MTKVIYTQQFTNNNSHTLEFDQCVSIHKDSRKSLSSSPLENDSFCRKKMKLIRRGSSKAVPPSDLSTTFTSSEPRLTVTENQQNTSVQSAVRRVRDTLVASDKRTILPLEMPFSRFESKGELHITKSILRELEVINQMDRKFILARARGVMYLHLVSCQQLQLKSLHYPLTLAKICFRPTRSRRTHSSRIFATNSLRKQWVSQGHFLSE
jgi:DNA mismatch repair ATPase MutL